MRKIDRKVNGRGIFCPGQDFIIIGFIGQAGVSAALTHRAAELHTRFSDDYVKRIRRQAGAAWKVTPELLESCGVTEWEYVDKGGIFAALWNISGAYGHGFIVDIKKIPVKQEIIEVCELFDLNPYRLRSGNCYLASAGRGLDTAAALLKEGIPAIVVGKIEEGIARRIVNDGGIAYLERPQPDEIGKIIGWPDETGEIG